MMITQGLQGRWVGGQGGQMGLVGLRQRKQAAVGL